ncbi:MAG: hypothetical protein P1V97_17935 [Planctomycetota bacterium]|nr:hypothetical protein [Planctomycetota bacterium]
MKLPQSLLSKLAVGGIGLALSVGCSVQADSAVEQKAPVKNTTQTKTPDKPETKTPVVVEKEKPTETECKVDPTIKKNPDRPADYCPGCGRG